MRAWGAAAFAAIAIASVSSAGEAVAQSVNFKISFSGFVDCQSPIPIQNVPIRGDGEGVLNADGSARAELTQTAFILSTKINFEGRLGAAPTSAPGGTAQVRVAGKNSLRLIWGLPNNQLITTINVRGQSCAASFVAQLRPGHSQYSLFDGNIYHYCGRPRVTSSSCEVR